MLSLTSLTFWGIVVFLPESLQWEHNYYRLMPNKIGSSVHDIVLKANMDKDAVSQIKRDLCKHKILVFKKQTKMIPRRQVQVSKLFGDKLDGSFFPHENVTEPYVYAISNDKERGVHAAHDMGWHVHGWNSKYLRPIVTFHMTHVPSDGHIAFVDLNKVVKGLSKQQKATWKKLHVRSGDLPPIVHPLIYTHPITKQETMYVHTNNMGPFFYNYGKDDSFEYSEESSQQLLKEVIAEVEKDTYQYEWEEGDFVMVDNLVIAHNYGIERQMPPKTVGLKILHRVATFTKWEASKKPKITKDHPYWDEETKDTEPEATKPKITDEL